MEDKIFNFLINYFSNMSDGGVDEMNNFRGNISSDEVVEWLNQNNLKQPDLEYIATSLEETIGTSPHSREVILDHLKQAAQWQKEQTINKASKWLADNVINYIWCSEGNLGIGDEFFIDFEKIMNI